MATFAGILAAVATVGTALGVPAAADAQSVAGRVVEEGTGAAVAGAAVFLLDAGGAVTGTSVTDDEGTFTVSARAAGDYTVRVEHIGFADVTTAELRLGANEATVVEIRLAVRPIGLEPLTVVARRQTGNRRLAEFYARAERNRLRGVGRIWLREDLEGGATIPQLLHTVPLRPGCVMEYFIDGSRLDPGESVERLALHERIEGVEVYRGAREIPGRFLRPGTCAVTLIWTRPVEGGRPLTWTRVIVFAVLGGVILLVR